jgi:hypothetical protein
MNRNGFVQFLSKLESSLETEHFDLCKIISLLLCHYGYELYISVTKTANKKCQGIQTQVCTMKF